MWHFPCCMCHLIVLSSLYTVNNNNRFCGIIYERAPDLCMLNNYHFELEMKHAFIYEVAHTARQTFNNISQFPCILNNQCSSCSLRTLKNISPQHNHLKIISVTQETLFVWNNFLHTRRKAVISVILWVGWLKGLLWRTQLPEEFTSRIFCSHRRCDKLKCGSFNRVLLCSSKQTNS